ncbi:hypothetical protein OPKNFCMD_5505 [Methylobacterium crusticola]|uniref:Tyrosine specific protein phosphatases domain-containing protein n=1 Tax=Methylobacterium crusticola TaxID=1697972 RepID=A0ABQ4R509_9HYPH|nr:dual specificity protein phosphatase family protein [Methylobacterium crusticola]GJD52738.1 hypothetical protein OPKNFCMD_5505 [Methylobacterium crusticola]
MPFDLRVCAAAEAASLAAGWATHAVSLVDAGYEPTAPLAPRSLVLTFEDSERPSAEGPTAGHVATALAFTRALEPDARLLVHCVAGLSRSTALAAAILVQHGVPAEAAIAQVGRMRPDMMPNTRLCRYADEALGTGGTIVQAVRRWEARLIAALDASGEEVA